MTELYELNATAPLAFKSVHTSPSTSEHSTSISSVQFLLQSAAELTSLVWNTGNVRKHVNLYMQKIQSATIEYLKLVETLCIETLPLRTTRKRTSIPQLARQIVDKPNLHRLYEFAFHTLPMWNDPSFVAELELEKKHQSLKRFICRSNHKNVHSIAL